MMTYIMLYVNNLQKSFIYCRNEKLFFNHTEREDRMNLTEKKRGRFARLSWAIHIEDEEKRKVILNTLQEAGHATSEASHMWHDKELKMLDIDFPAAEFLHDKLRPSKHGYTLLRKEPCRGWIAYVDENTNLAPRVTNNSLFSRRRYASN